MIIDNLQRSMVYQNYSMRLDGDFFLDLKDKMDQLVGEINGRFSTPRWSPIRYIFGCINQVRTREMLVIK